MNLRMLLGNQQTLVVICMCVHVYSSSQDVDKPVLHLAYSFFLYLKSLWFCPTRLLDHTFISERELSCSIFCPDTSAFL